MFIRELTPVHNFLNTTRTTSRTPSHRPPPARPNISRNPQILKKRRIHRLPTRNPRPRKRKRIRAMQTHPIRLRLNMSRIHVKIQVSRVPSVVRIDISEERTPRACLIGVRIQQHTGVNCIVVSIHAVDVVVDEPLAGVEFRACLPVYDENVGAFDCGGTAARCGNRSKGVFQWELGGLETRDEAELSY